MSNKFLIIVVATVAIFFGTLFVTKNKSNPEGGGNKTAQTSNHILGNENGSVTLVEYGDFQCPACRAFHPLVKQIVEKYKTDLKFQFKNFPLVQIHKNAFLAARAAEAASRQDKFWEMHDLLYTNQPAWSELNDPLPTFTSYANQLSLNVDQFKTDYGSSAINDLINADYQEAIKAGANSTPTFILNGQKIQNPDSAEAFDKLIADAIAAKKKQ